MEANAFARQYIEKYNEFFCQRILPCCGAASGIIPFGITAEAWGAATALGRDRAGNARLILDPGSMAWS
jgi:hypothetical protein